LLNFCKLLILAGVAQLVEHLICNQRVGGSSPSASSISSTESGDYSCRKATVGFTEIARRVGTMAAITATVASNSETAM
jgi:hypothetical protein